jgi:hypothetical protein
LRLQSEHGGEGAMNRSDVYAAIDGERDYQSAAWGRGGTMRSTSSEADGSHEVGSYLLLMEQYLTEARQAYTKNAGDLPALDQLRKVVALGVACFEEHGVPARGVFPNRG